MLILSRRVGENVVIDGHIIVKVLGFAGNQVRLGVEAPKHIVVHREEVVERIALEREIAELLSDPR